MIGSRRHLQVRPQAGKKVVKIRFRVTADLPAGASASIGDVLVQAGGTATGWVPHVTELPWMAGVVGG